MIPAFRSQKNSILKRLNYIFHMQQHISYTKLVPIALFIAIFSVFLLPMNLLSDNPDEQSTVKTVDDLKSESVKIVDIENPIQNAKVTFEYGKASHPINGKVYSHQGVDLAQKLGTLIQSAADGTVITVNQPEKLKKGYGNHVIINHEGFQTLYAHMDSIYVQVGQSVTQGDKIGTVGNSGVSTGPHLHFELRVEGECVNPHNYIDF